MASKSKKELKALSLGRGGVAQSSGTGAAVQEKEKKSSKLFGITMGKKKSKDGETILPDKDKRKNKGGGGTKGKAKAEPEPTVPETLRDLDGSPGFARHGLSSPTQTTAGKAPLEGTFYPPGALKPLSGVPPNADGTGAYTSIRDGYDKLEPSPEHPISQHQEGATTQSESQEISKLRKAVALFEIESKRFQREKDELKYLVANYEGQLAEVAVTSRPLTSGDNKKMEELKKKNIELEQELTLVREEKSAIQEQQNVAKFEVASARESLEKLEQEVLRQSQLAEEADKDKRVLEEKLHEAEQKLALTVEKDRDAMEQEKRRLVNETKDLFDKFQEAEKEAFKSADQIVKLTKKMDQEEIQRQSLLTELQKEKDSSAQLRKQLEENNDQICNCNKELQAKQEVVDGLAEQLAKAEQELLATSQHLQQQQVDMKKVQADLQEAEKEVFESAKQVVNLTKKMEEKEFQHEALLAELQKEKEASAQIRERLQQSEAKVGEYARGSEEEKAKLIQQLQSANEENARKDVQLEEQKREILTKARQLDDMQKEMAKQLNALREEHLRCQPVRREDELDVLLEGQNGAGASPHSSLTEQQKMGEWRELLNAKDAEIHRLQEESDKLKEALDNEKLQNSLLEKTTTTLQEELGKVQPVSKKPGEAPPDRFQKLFHAQGPVIGRTRSGSSPSSDVADRVTVQALEKKLEDEVKLRTTLEQEICYLQAQLDGSKGISKERSGHFSTATAPVASQSGDDAFSLGMAARIEESEENMQFSEERISERQTETDSSQEQFLAQMERQSHHILDLKEEIKSKNMHLEISEEELEKAKREIEQLAQQVESLKARLAVSEDEGKQDGRETESVEVIRQQLIKFQQDVEYWERLCQEKEQGIRHWCDVAERGQHTIEDLGKTVVELKAEKSQMEELQGEWSEKVAQLEEMKDTLAFRDESIAAMEEQVRNLMSEKQEVEQTLQDREREVGRVRDELECTRMQAVMYEEDFQQERRDREKAHGMLDELRGRLSYDKNVFETQLQEYQTTIAHLQSQVEENSRKGELAHENGRLRHELLEIGTERDAAMQQVRSYKKQADGFKRQLEEQQRRVENLQQQLEHLAGIEMRANELIAEREQFEKHMQSQRSASAADQRRAERLQKEVDDLVQGKERLEQETAKLKSSNVILQKRLKETKDQKTEVEERLRHLQFSQSQQQRPCSHHGEANEGEQSQGATRGNGDETELQAREQQEAWMAVKREEQQRLQSEAAHYHQQQQRLSAMARPQAGHQQIDQTYFQEHQPVFNAPQERQAAMLQQPLATGGRMFRDHSNHQSFTSRGFLGEYGDSQGPQTITFGSYTDPSFKRDYGSQMSAEAPAAIGSSTPLYDQNTSASWKQKRHQTHAVALVSFNPQAATPLEQEALSRSKAAEHNHDLSPTGIPPCDMSPGQLVTARSNLSPTARRRLNDRHTCEPSPIAEQTTGFSAQDFLGGTGAMEGKNEGEKLRARQSGEPGQEHPEGKVFDIPLDPNLVCPKCGMKFRHGEIQRLKLHFERCSGQI